MIFGCSLFIGGLLFFCPSKGQSVNIGEAELIYTEDEIPIRYDGSLSTIRKDGTMYYFHSFGCRIEPDTHRRSRHSWHYGTPKDPLKVHHMSKEDDDFWDYNGYHQDTPEEGIWILGMYKRDNGDLLGITHSEINYTDVHREQQFAIGLGYSTDEGESWTYCGEIIRGADNRVNVGGGAYIIRDGYLHIYYNDIDLSDTNKIQCVARAKLDQVLKDAANHEVGEWFKYRDGKWDVPGLSDSWGTAVVPRVYGGEDVHSDAAYCTAMGKYLLTVQTHLANKLLLFSSEDGVNWTEEAVVDIGAEDEMQPYSSFVDFDGPADDCHQVDGDFYIYFPRKRYKDHEYDYMYRRHITVENQ